MTKPYYECHITIQHSHCSLELERIQDAIEDNGWKYSVIDGDPTIGDGCFCYATTHISAKAELKTVIDQMAAVAESLSAQDMRVIRQKVELVVYDTKQKKGLL